MYPPLLNPEEDGPSLLLFVTPPPAESLGNQVGRLTFTLFELLGPLSPYDVAQRMPLSSALQFFGVWSGSMALAESRPIDVCLETIYGLNSGVFLCTLLHCLILTGAWFGALSRVCLHASLPRLLSFSAPPGYVLLYVQFCKPIAEMWTVFPPDGMRIDYEGALSRRLHVLTYGPAWAST